ncbi:MAG: SDR family oxidoreductase [Cyanobacteria bacterium SZAS-4]|nr:SDR family oxidoreductase [Cyanobacteria bacterium SZAS-4]
MFKTNKFVAISALLGAVSIGRAAIKSFKRISYNDRVVVITGGSRGLGLAMARQLAREGAKLALLARDEKELQVACDELQTYTTAEYFTCDVRSEEQVNSAIAAVLQRFGTIDVLINDAGVIQVGPLEDMTVADFKDTMNNHFFASLYTTMAVLPTMREKHFGRIVNISSVGGKISVPHLLPYSASKFALAGFSQGLRSEVMKDGITVTTVCPGLMRTGSHLQAEFKGHNKLEYAWFSTLNGLPLLSTAAESAAKNILEGCRNGDAEVILTLPAQLAVKIQAIFPEETADILSLVNRLLPREGGIGIEKQTGKNSQSVLSPNPLTTMIENAAVTNNQFVAD